MVVEKMIENKKETVEWERGDKTNEKDKGRVLMRCEINRTKDERICLEMTFSLGVHNQTVS